ncbi:MAG: PEP-utilizing enzyme [Candidatus Woesearchaeota archaeon]
MILPEIKNTVWKKIGTWETPFLQDHMVVSGTNRGPFSKLGFFKSWFSATMYLEGSFFVNADDYRRFYEEESQGYLKEGLSYFIRIQNLMKEYACDSYAFVEKVKRQNLNELSNSELQQLFREFEEIIDKVMVLGEVIQPLDRILKEILTDKLEKYLKDQSEAEINQVIASLTSPKGNLTIVNERIELLDIAKEVKSLSTNKEKFSSDLTPLKKDHPSIYQKILQHHQRYSWMANCNWHLPQFTLEHYWERILNTTHPNRELEKISQDRRSVRESFEKEMQKIQAAGVKVEELVEVIRTFITTKMNNWNTVSICGNQCLPLFEELSHRCGLTLEQFFLSTSTEISQRLEGEKLPVFTSPKRGVVRFGDKITILTPEESKEANTFVQHVEGLSEAKGQVVFPGKVQGEVVVIKTIAEFSKMKKDAILVCPMTNPDFVPLLHKAKAIVTDQGGILCHAAIVSREFNIPCIVGTEIATKIFKDGDLIEVDAEKGIVRKIR